MNQIGSTAKVCAVVGAGPGLGLAIARRFGRSGHRIALLARTARHLDTMVRTLAGEGIEAEGFEADVTHPDSLVSAFDAIRKRFGTVDVLEYSPVPALAADLHDWIAVGTSARTVDALMKLMVYGAITSVQQVLPDMLARGGGSILLTTSGSGILPLQSLTPIGMVMAAARNYAFCLHEALAPKGVYAGTVCISVLIEKGHAVGDPNRIAEVYHDMHEARDRVETNIVSDEHPHEHHARDMRQRGLAIPQ